MALEVEILDVDESGSTLDVSVSVTVDDTETVDYELNINDTGTGGEVTRSGTLNGGSGSYPGDSNIEEASFGIGDTSGGTVTAVITAPDRYVGSEYQSQEKWGDSGDGSVGEPTIDVSNCDPQPTSDGDLDVSYTLAPTDDTSGDVGITIRVDGQRVGYENHYVPARGGSFSQTIPADNLPRGQDMPVEIGVDGDFSDCGTVTVESDDPADDPDDGDDSDDPAEPSITDCSITNDNPLRMTVRVDGDGSRGSTDAAVVVDGQQVAVVTLDYTLNPIDNEIEVSSDRLPTGEDMPVEIRL